MPTPIPVDDFVSFGSTLAFDTNAIVSIRQKWWDPWVVREDLTCTAVAWQVSPNVGYCQLHRRYGPTAERNGTKTNREKLNLDGWYVRIEVICADGSRLWHGFIDDTGEEDSGFVAMNELDVDLLPIVVNRPTGKQTFTGVGMLAALDRSPILATMFLTTEANQGVVYRGGPDLTEMRWAESPPHFNPRSSADQSNQNTRQIETRTLSDYPVPDQTVDASTPITRDAYIFGWVGLYSLPDEIFTLDMWTPRQICQYLVAYASPRNRDFREVMPIAIDRETQIPDFGNPELDCDGLTLKQSLDQLLAENEGLGYWCYVDEPTNQLRIVPYTILRDAITISGDTIAANAVQFDLHLVTDPVTQYTLQRSLSSRYNQIVIRGAKQKKVFTIPFSRLANGWSAADVTAYNTAFPDTFELDLATEHAKRDGLEQSAFRHIYRNFVLLHTWDFRVTANNIDFSQIFEVANRYEISDDGRYYPYPARMQILDMLPLKDRVNYQTGDKRAEHKTTRAPFRRTNVYSRAHSATFGIGAGMQVMDGKPTSWVDRAKRHTLYSINDPDYSLDVRPLKSEHSIGITIDVLGAPQTIMANSVTNQFISHLPPLMYNALFVTLAMEDDRYFESVYPASASVADVDNVFRKVLDFGDRFQQIELLDTTIVGFDSNDFLRRDARDFVRDDSEEMETLARQVYEWYNRTRHVLRVNTRRCTSFIWPGQFIKDLNPMEAPNNQHSVPINCIVSEVAITLPVGYDGAETRPTFSIVTNRGDIDFLYYAPRTV